MRDTRATIVFSVDFECDLDLSQELKGLNSHLESSGPYLKGKDVSSGDLALAPKLHHMQVALKAFKVQSQLLDELALVHRMQQQNVQHDVVWHTAYSAITNAHFCCVERCTVSCRALRSHRT